VSTRSRVLVLGLNGAAVAAGFTTELLTTCGALLHPWALLPCRRVRLRQHDELLATLRRASPRRVFERLPELLLDELGEAGGWTGRGLA
jgi:hypothetical protein